MFKNQFICGQEHQNDQDKDGKTLQETQAKTKDNPSQIVRLFHIRKSIKSDFIFQLQIYPILDFAGSWDIIGWSFYYNSYLKSHARVTFPYGPILTGITVFRAKL